MKPVQQVVQQKASSYLNIRLVKYLGLFAIAAGLVAIIFGIVYYQQPASVPFTVLLELYAALSIVIGIVVWWLVLAQESYQLAQDELDKQNLQLQQEINERKQAEVALRDNEERFRTLVANIPGVVYRCLDDADWTMEFISAAIADLSGYPAVDFTHSRVCTFASIVHPEDASEVDAIIRNALAKQQPYLVEYRIIRADNTVRWVSEKGQGVFGADGTLLYLDGVIFDITERKQAEAALVEREERFRIAAQSASDLIYEWDISGNTLNWFGDIDSQLGYEQGDFPRTLEAWEQMIHPNDYDRVITSLNRHLTTGELYREEYRVRREDGTYVVWIDRGAALRDEAGNPYKWIGVNTDITDRKQAEEALMLYKRAVDSSSDAIGLADPTGTLFYQNSAHAELYGCETVEVFNQTGGIAACSFDSEVLQAQAQAFNSGQAWIGESEEVSRSGRRFSGFVRVNSIKDESGKLLGWVGTVTDISEAKRDEESLRQKAQQEQLLNQLANQIRSSLNIDEILQTAVDSIRELMQIDNCNFVWYRPHATPPTWEATHEAKLAAMPSQLGLYPSEMIGSAAEKLLNLEILQHDDVRTIADPVWRQLLLSLEAKSTIDVPILTSTGNIGVINCTHCCSLRPWQDSEVELLRSVANQLAIALNQADLYKRSRLAAETAQAQAQQLEHTLQELQHTQAQLVQTEKMSSLGQLVAGVAHEINNPVNFIHGNLSHAGGYTQDLLRLVALYQKHYPTPCSEIQAEAEAIDLDFLLEDLPNLLTSMKVGTDRIRQIVLALRNFSRMDEAEMKTVDLHNGIDSTLMILQNRLKDNAEHVGIEVVKDYGNLPAIECYVGQLNQVFMNILSNAIDALDEYNDQRPAAAVKQQPSRITIRTELINRRVHICISDNGPGMSEQTRQRLFEPFFTTKPIGKGTGLGLSISYQVVVDRHGGELRCVSAPGQGATFLLELPLVQTVTPLLTCPSS